MVDEQMLMVSASIQKFNREETSVFTFAESENQNKDGMLTMTCGPCMNQ